VFSERIAALSGLKVTSAVRDPAARDPEHLHVLTSGRDLVGFFNGIFRGLPSGDVKKAIEN
jgi:hypothetical protein